MESLEGIAKLIVKIQKETKRGTAYEKYDTAFLWRLGQEIERFSEFARNHKDVVAEILDYLDSRNIRSSPLLLKNAETARRTWRNESSYIQSTNRASYGKLKAVLPILDPDFALQVKLPKQEVKRALDALNEATYEEILSYVRLIRQTYDPKSLSLDLDEFYSNLHSTNNYLESAVMNGNCKAIDDFRSRYSREFVKNIRMLIAALRSEETLKRMSKIPDLKPDQLPRSKTDIDNQLFEIISVLNTLRYGNPAMRNRVRGRIGIFKLGELSTLMKAISDDEELERFLRGKKLLQKIRRSTSPNNLQPV